MKHKYIDLYDPDNNYYGHDTDRNGNKFLVYKLKTGFDKRSQQPVLNYSSNWKHQSKDNATNHRTQVGIMLSDHECVTMGYCHGNVNNYGVFMHTFVHLPNHRKWTLINTCMPRDAEVIKDLQLECHHSGSSKAQFIRGFIQNYKHTTNRINPFHDWTFAHLDSMANKYYPNCPKASVTQAYLKLAMTAEYHYRNPRTNHPSTLNKKVKALGVFQALLDDARPDRVANFSKGKSRKYLNHAYYYFVKDRLPRLFYDQHKIDKIRNKHIDPIDSMYGLGFNMSVARHSKYPLISHGHNANNLFSNNMEDKRKRFRHHTSPNIQW